MLTNWNVLFLFHFSIAVVRKELDEAVDQRVARKTPGSTNGDSTPDQRRRRWPGVESTLAQHRTSKIHQPPMITQVPSGQGHVVNLLHGGRDENNLAIYSGMFRGRLSGLLVCFVFHRGVIGGRRDCPVTINSLQSPTPEIFPSWRKFDLNPIL